MKIRFIGTETEKIGQILDNPTDPRQSQLITNKALREIQAGTIVSGMFVRTKSSSDERQYIPTDKVELNVDPANYVSDIQVTDHKNANYEFSFVPRVPGRYQVGVKLNGRYIAGSPVEMNVTKRNLRRQCMYEMPRGTYHPSGPSGVAVSKEGDIAVADGSNHYIVIFDKTGNFLRRLSNYGMREGDLRHAQGVAFNSRDELVVADRDNDRIQVLDRKSGRRPSAVGAALRGSLTHQLESMWMIEIV